MSLSAEEGEVVVEAAQEVEVLGRFAPEAYLHR